MAGQIAVKNRATADAWVSKAKALNERADEVNKRVSALLRQLDEGSAGDVVTTLVQAGGTLLTAANEIFTGVTQICNAISSVISLVQDVVGGLVDAVKGIFS